MDICEIIEKLKDILSSDYPSRRVYDKDVADALSISKESLSHFKKKGTIPFEQIAKFCAKKEISINWVLFGQLPKSLVEETEKYTKIKYFSKIHASAGGGGFNYEDEYEYLNIDRRVLESINKRDTIDIKKIEALNVIGDSMEPTLCDRDVVLFYRDRADIDRGGIFVVSTNAGLFVKRVALKTDGSLELISDNKIYNSELLSPYELDSIKFLGRVIGKVAQL